MIVVWLFLAVPWVCLRFMIVVFPDHTHLLFFIPCISEFPAVFNINVKLRFLDLQFIPYSNDFKSFIPFSNLLHLGLAISSKFGFRHRSTNVQYWFLRFLHCLKHQLMGSKEQMAHN